MNDQPRHLISRSILLLIGLVACSVSAIEGPDMLLVRQQDHDVLVIRAWQTAPMTAGLWLWPVPIGTTVAVAQEIDVRSLRSAVWLGHMPLSYPNAWRLRSYCDLMNHSNALPLPTLALGAFGSLAALEVAAAREGIPLTPEARQFGTDILASGAHVAAVGWRDRDDSPAGRDLADLAAPLAAVVLTMPKVLTAIPVKSNRQHGGCIGQLIAIGRDPLVPAPEHRDRWEVSLLVGRAAAGPLAAARSAGITDADTTWGVTALALKQCDDQTALTLVRLDPLRDLSGPTARVAASWCGLHPDPLHRHALAQVLTDPAAGFTGFEAAFSLWAWAQHRTNESVDLLEAWSADPDPFVRSEALMNLTIVDSSRAIERDLDVLAAFPQPCERSQSIVNLVGSRLVRHDLRAHGERLHGIASDGSGWLEWRFAEQMSGSFGSDVQLSSRLAADQLTAGAWAVVALANNVDSRAIRTIVHSLLETAILQCAALAGPKRGGSLGDGFSSDFWNARLILFPQRSDLSWPTLNRLEVACAEQPGIRDSLLRQVLRDQRLPAVAATVLLASIGSWWPSDERRAVAILDAASDTCRYLQVRFPGIADRHDFVEVSLPLDAVGAAYVLAQRGITAPVLAALHRATDPALRNELVFALALCPERNAEVAQAIATWRQDVARLPFDDPGRPHAWQTRDRIDHHERTAQTPGRAAYTARFATDFRTRWQR